MNSTHKIVALLVCLPSLAYADSNTANLFNAMTVCGRAVNKYRCEFARIGDVSL
jgi:hypothetical protein